MEKLQTPASLPERKGNRPPNDLANVKCIDVTPFLFPLKKWVGYTTLPKYSRNQEFEADRKAIEILKALGENNPEKELSQALQLLLDKYGNTGGGFLDSHPSTSERIQRLKSVDQHRP